MSLTLFPKKRRSKPKDGILKTVANVGIHQVTFETDFMQSNPGLQIFWIPGKPEGSELLPRFKRAFDRARRQHLQRVCDTAQQPITVKE